MAVNYTSPSDIAAYLWSTIAAEDLTIIDREEAAKRMGQTLDALVKLERSHGFFYNWYDPRDGSTLKTCDRSYAPTKHASPRPSNSSKVSSPGMWATGC